MPATACRIESLDRAVREDEIAGLVEEVKRSPGDRDSLVDLLPEWHPLYAGRSTNETVRLRGYVLAAFEDVGLPEAAIPYVLEELESGEDAYLVAAAAKALRGLARPTSEVVPFLFKAVDNIRSRDDALTFESYKPQWPLSRYTTALEEIFNTFGWLGASARCALAGLEALQADRHHPFSTRTRAAIEDALDRIRSGKAAADTGCCLPSISNRHGERRRGSGSVADIELQDQDGEIFRYGDLFSQTPSIVVFFYSRCSNPNKCSLTITKLARLQQAIRQAGLEGRIKTAAITYDPGYDLPQRLKAYGENRGVRFPPITGC
jgi:protein SCO1/2